MLTPLFSDDFESGGFAGLSLFGSGFSVVSAAPRHGTYCAELVAPAGAGAYGLVYAPIAASAKTVVRVGVRVKVLPPGDQELLALWDAGGNVGARIYVDSDGRLWAQMYNSGFAVAVSGPLVDTSWHLLELQANLPGYHTCDWKVDGVLQTRATVVGPASSVANVGLGTAFASATGGTIDYDDWAVASWTDAAADWLGDIVPPQSAAPGAIDSAEALGTPVLSRGAHPAAIASVETLGEPAVTGGSLVIRPAGIVSAQALGAPTVPPPTSRVAPAGIPSALSIGAPLVSAGGAQVILAPAIGSGEQLGRPGALQFTGRRVLPVGWAAGACGHPTVALTGPTTIAPVGIAAP